MHAEHKDNFHEAFAMYDGDPTVPRGGFRKLREWFGFNSYGWQIFYGSDGSGATLHWHAAALNILYVGKKEWRITPPRHRGFTGLTAQKVKAQIGDEPFTLRCLQLPGDLIYIPDHWGHMTINHGFGIGVAAIVKQRERILPGHVGKYDGDPEPWRGESAGGDAPGEADGRKAKSRREANPRPGPPVREDVSLRGRRGGPMAKHQRDVATRPRPDDGGRHERSARHVPFFFVHINKTGGTSLIHMLIEHCSNDEYVKEKWATPRGVKHRSFHSTAHSYIERHGKRVWDKAYTFAVVRHPLARQVSNFFFLAANCEKDGKKCGGDRLIPEGMGPGSSATEEEKIAAFHAWMARLYEAYPPGSPENHLMGSKGHGNEEYPTMNATQTSWLVDPTGQNIVVEEVFRLESFSGNMEELMRAIPCLARAPQKTLTSVNLTPSVSLELRFCDGRCVQCCVLLRSQARVQFSSPV